MAIFVVGVFLRTYNFHAWLEFRSDQARDAYRTDQVVSGEKPWPLVGPFLSHSGPTEDESFHVGPIYYYFQIISAEIFGSYPDKLAYPDVFFAILSIPLFYLFLREYFGKNVSLGLTGLYSIGAYIIRYSRFAWSCNSIPFFVLLFLLSLFKLWDKNEKTAWAWAVALGVAWGVGFQLHALTMIAFSGTAFLVFIFSMRKNPATWKKWSVVLAIFVLLNSAQVVGEIKTNFENTRALSRFLFQNGSADNPSGLDSSNPINHAGVSTLLKNDIDCSLEANFLYLSSYNDVAFGRENCQGNYWKLFSRSNTKKHSKVSWIKIGDVVLFSSLVFSLVGYFLLLFYDKKEPNERKRRFLHLLVLYTGLAFLLMLPLSSGKFGDLRYFSLLFFLPFLFLGLIAKLLFEKVAPKYIAIPVAAVIFSLFAASNVSAITYRLSILSKKEGMDSGTAVLGEMEDTLDYAISHSNGQKKIYLGGNRSLTAHSFDSLQYLAGKQNVGLIKFGDKDKLDPAKKPAFCVDDKIDKKEAVYGYKKVGNVYIYQINK
ncbi:MAG: glycosyltransferase family 39 protein [Candidatus Pacebacteria bacterium]|nr:glycosyltransferase family 39 protein [Candidatus Paceibacterota bacterium]